MDNKEALAIGMPLRPADGSDGRWAYWGSPKAKCGFDTCDSHPSYHNAWGSDWATDLYAASGTKVYFRYTGPTGKVSLSLSPPTNTSCGAGKRVRINIAIDGRSLGYVQYEHLNTSGTNFADGITNGEYLGSIKWWGNLSCYAVKSSTGLQHVHFAATQTNRFSCWIDYGSVGTLVSHNSPIAILGANNTAARSKCVAGISVSAYNQWIVQWTGDTNPQKTSWYVNSQLKRYWIPTSAVFYCLKNKGKPGPVALQTEVLNLLPDSGSTMTCS
ncbi:MAG: hypothetical protein WD598_17780 [Acidimicrobiia bacterium]